MSKETHITPTRQLGLFDTVCIIVGIVIGTGIYRTTPAVATACPNSTVLILLWIAGGLLSLIGALCYAELASAFPDESGGDYVFLSHSYGHGTGFLFAWSEFWIVRTGNIGLMAIIFGEYANQAIEWRVFGSQIDVPNVAYAIGAVIVLTYTNVLGVRVGKVTQNVLTSVKVVALLSIFVVAILVLRPAEPQELKPVSKDISLLTAMLFVFFTYGGWNEMSFVAAEVHNPRKNIWRSLVVGTLLITLVYVCVNLAFLRAMGLQGFRDSQAVAADMLALAMGDAGRVLISLLVCISCLGAINGMLFTGARIAYATGQRHPMAAALSKWDPHRDAPVRALLGLGLVTLVLLCTLGLYNDGFQRLVFFTMPVFWLFKLLVVIGLFVLRFRGTLPSYRQTVPIYPLTPLIFAATCAFVLYSSTAFAITQREYDAFIALGIVAVGIPFAYLVPTRGK